MSRNSISIKKLGIWSAGAVLGACSASGGGGGFGPQDGGAASAGVGGGGTAGAGGGQGGASGGAAGSNGGAAGSSGGAAGSSGGAAGAGATGGFGGAAGGSACWDTTSCTPGQVCKKSCGPCSFQTKTCYSNGKWLAPGGCVPDECLPGSIQFTPTGCPTGQIKSQSCGNDCKWAATSACSTKYTWKTMATAPIPGRYYAGSAWTGKELVVAFGYTSGFKYANDAASYDPAANKWTAAPIAPVVARREVPGAWTGTEAIFWGGYGSPSPYYKNDGARYNLVTKKWASITTVGAPSGRYRHVMVWDNVGKQMIVWGGYGTSPSYKNDGGRYDPTTNTWKPIALSPLSGRYYPGYAWDAASRRLYVWGGYGTSPSYKNDGAYYDAAANKWTMLPASPLPGRRQMGAAVAGGKFLVWGGYATPSPYYKDDGAVYDPATSKWTMMPKPPMSGFREPHVATDGKKVFFFGGYSSPLSEGGAIFDVAGNKWETVNAGPLGDRYGGVSAWTPQGPLVWGGYSGGYLGNGAIYNP